MHKKLLLGTILSIALIFVCNFCFAAENNEHPIQDAANSVKNVVGGAENAIENGAKDISNTTKNATNSMENAGNNIGHDAKNTMNTVTNNNHKATTNTNNYNATRTSASGDTTLLGMNSTAWIWLVLGIATIAIIALVWYYSKQNVNNHNNKRLD